MILVFRRRPHLNLCLLDLAFRLCNPTFATRATAVPHLIHNEQTKLFAGMIDRVGTVCLAIGVATPVSAFVIGGMDWRIHRPTSSGAECFGGPARMTVLQLFILFGLPVLIAIAGVLAPAIRRRHARNRA